MVKMWINIQMNRLYWLIRLYRFFFFLFYYNSIGIDKYIRLSIPKKGNNLSIEDRAKNKELARKRIIIENFYGRSKSLWSILSIKFRWYLIFFFNNGSKKKNQFNNVFKMINRKNLTSSSSFNILNKINCLIL